MKKAKRKDKLKRKRRNPIILKDLILRIQEPCLILNDGSPNGRGLSTARNMEGRTCFEDLKEDSKMPRRVSRNDWLESGAVEDVAVTKTRYGKKRN